MFNANHKIYFILLIVLSTNLLMPDPYKPLDIKFLKKKSKAKTEKTSKPKSKSKSKSQSKSFSDLIKDYKKIDGLFTFYYHKETNDYLMEILPSQMGEIFLLNLTRDSGDGYYLDAGSMLNEFPFIINKVGNRIQIINKNIKFRVDSSKAFSKSLDNLSNSLVSSAIIKSEPHIEKGSVLVDLSDLFINDLEHLRQKSNGKFVLDKKNSFFTSIKSFPLNSEIEVSLHFMTKKYKYVYTLPNSRSMIPKYHISLSKINQSAYKPRKADDRVGYFTTIYQDYSDMFNESAYERYINRWHLEKENPNDKVSPAKEPIVYWIENTVPEEFRFAVRRGVLAWNEAFKAAGISNAITVKQMPDNADWDPADIRYNTIRWILQPGRGYAVGPSRANPFTGELYDADIRISADFVRSWFNEFEEFVDPLINSMDFEYSLEESENIKEPHLELCKYGDELKDEMAFSWNVMKSMGIIKGTDAELREFINNGITDLILHEVGHTLGLRHNFKASSIYSPEQLSDINFTNKNGISGSVMDYQPINIFDKGKNFFQIKPGVYDIWAIQYGYSISNPNSRGSEQKLLNEIASKSTFSNLVYGTDEDTFGTSSRGIDPKSCAWDLSSDPKKYYKHKIELVKKLWKEIPENFEKKGARYQKFKRVFSQGIRQYYSASRNIAKFIGGLYHSRHHIGQNGLQPTFKVVAAKDQRSALQFLDQNILSKDAFNFSPILLNKLAPERFWDFKGSIWNSRIDYPIHMMVEWIQAGTLFRLFHPNIIRRIQDNELKVDSKKDKYTMVEHFNQITNIVWKELLEKENINSFRRILQQNHIKVLSIILLDRNMLPADAHSLARLEIKKIIDLIDKILINQSIDAYTLAHLDESKNKLEAVYNAQKIIN